MPAPTATTLTSYEAERAARIEDNKRRLAELGLLQHPLSGAAEAAQRADKRRRRSEAAAGGGVASSSEPPAATRQSRRQRGEAPEHGMQGYGPSGSSRQYSSSSPKAPRLGATQRQPLDLAALESSGSSDPAIDAHNLMRVRSMSERALQTRIWKIRRVDKLLSFVKVLEACGLEELAAEAREALAEMTGGQLGAAS